MKHRVDLDFIGLGNAGNAYGGYLHAWSFFETDGIGWFDDFRRDALSAVGSRFLPIYRMADGEYRFLMGRRFNPKRRPVWREVVALTAERLRIRNPDRWKTSWGEEYPPAETRRLRLELVDHLRCLSQYGYLACYLNDNGLDAFTEYNNLLPIFFESQKIRFDQTNYVPFHFAPSLFISYGWKDFIQGRKILIVTSLDLVKELRIRETLNKMGASMIEFLCISVNASMKDRLNLSGVGEVPDLCLVAAGIGSANIMRQLMPLNRLSVDIGGLMNCLVDPGCRQHGGIIGLPEF